MTLYLKIRELVEEITEIGDAIDLIIALERKFDMRGATYTRDDVNMAFRDYLESYEQDPRDMTDDEWSVFASGWLWSKGYADIMGQDMRTAIVDDLYELKIINGVDF